MSEQGKLDSLVSKIQGRAVKSPHQLFAEKSQMLRWFHERDQPPFPRHPVRPPALSTAFTGKAIS